MRIRSTKPEFWRSERIASVSWDARLVLKGLESYVDDNGVGKDDIALIVSDVFPRDLARESPGTLGKVQKAITELHTATLVWRYEVDGTKLLYLSWWESAQYINKPGRGRFRRPDGTIEYGESEICGSFQQSPGIPGNPPVGTGEQGNRGTGELKDLLTADASSEIDPATYPAAFEEWWEHYPRKVGKRNAFRAWRGARKRTSDQQLIEGAQRYAADPNRADQFTKHPEGWLNRDGWTDAPLPAAGTRNGNRGPVKSTADLRVAQVQALKTQPSARLELER